MQQRTRLIRNEGKMTNEPDIRIEETRSLLTGARRYKFYIRGSYTGSANSRKAAMRLAKEMLDKIKSKENS